MVFAVFVALVLVWADIIVVSGSPTNNSSIAAAAIAKVNVTLLPVYSSTRLQSALINLTRILDISVYFVKEGTFIIPLAE